MQGNTRAPVDYSYSGIVGQQPDDPLFAETAFYCSTNYIVNYLCAG